MTPSQIIALVRDVAIVAALAFVVLWIRRDGENVVKVDDLKAVTAQLNSNTATVAGWQKQASAAEVQRENDVATVTAHIDAQRAPVFVQPTAAAGRACPVPGAAIGAAGSGQPAASGSADAGSGVDIRPQLNAFELRYEAALAGCRKIAASWPINPP